MTHNSTIPIKTLDLNLHTCTHGNNLRYRTYFRILLKRGQTHSGKLRGWINTNRGGGGAHPAPEINPETNTCMLSMVSKNDALVSISSSHHFMQKGPLKYYISLVTVIIFLTM